MGAEGLENAAVVARGSLAERGPTLPDDHVALAADIVTIRNDFLPTHRAAAAHPVRVRSLLAGHRRLRPPLFHQNSSHRPLSPHQARLNHPYYSTNRRVNQTFVRIHVQTLLTQRHKDTNTRSGPG